MNNFAQDQTGTVKTTKFAHEWVEPGSATSQPTAADKGVKEAESAANVIPIDAAKRGKGVEEAPFTSLPITNGEFIAGIFTDLPEEALAIVTAFAGDPSAPRAGGWPPQAAVAVDRVCQPDLNTYVNCASVYPDEDGQVAAKLDCAAAYHVLVLDDVGTKVERASLGNITATWSLETSSC